MQPSSRFAGFYRLSIEERYNLLRESTSLSDEDARALSGDSGLRLQQADKMIENAVGVFGLPLGIATNFSINGRDYLIPMAIEEPSVVAGASFAARLARDGGGFQSASDPALMIGQIQVLDTPDPWAARFDLLANQQRLLDLANEVDPVITQLGGGARRIEVRVLEQTHVGPMVVVHLIYDTRDAMGANAVNTALEALAPMVAEISGGRTLLRILSNLADERLARAKCSIPVSSLAHNDYDGTDVAHRIVEAWAFAAADPYRATTHNKGIMNGIDAVVIATGNDWRAVEAGAHAYAARDGRYMPLSTWQFNNRAPAAQDCLVGTLELPLAVGTVGGATRVHPAAKAALKLLGVSSSQELAQVIAAVGLAQNLAALRALASEGIQHGHMRLHARQVAIAAGAEGEMVDQVVQAMLREQTVRLDRAQAILERLKAQ